MRNVTDRHGGLSQHSRTRAGYPLPLFQSGSPINIQDPGLRFAPPWASEVYHAFGVPLRSELLKLPYCFFKQEYEKVRFKISLHTLITGSGYLRTSSPSKSISTW